MSTPKPCIHCGGSGLLYDRRVGRKHTFSCNFCLGTGWDEVHPPVPGILSAEGMSTETFRTLRAYLVSDSATRGPWPFS